MVILNLRPDVFTVPLRPDTQSVCQPWLLGGTGWSKRTLVLNQHCYPIPGMLSAIRAIWSTLMLPWLSQSCIDGFRYMPRLKMFWWTIQPFDDLGARTHLRERPEVAKNDVQYGHKWQPHLRMPKGGIRQLTTTAHGAEMKQSLSLCVSLSELQDLPVHVCKRTTQEPSGRECTSGDVATVMTW